MSIDSRLKRLLTLGREHYQAGDYDKAERYLSEVVREHKGFADLYNMLGVIHHDRGRFVKAQEAFEEALRINPQYTEAALNLSVTYNDLGRYAEARDVYVRAINRTRAESRSLDSFVKGKLANMHADLGTAYASAGLGVEAVREYQKALELCPSFVDLRTRLANLHRDQGRVEESIRELEIVKATNPSYAPGRVGLGLAYYAANRRPDAAKEWEAAVSLAPGDRTAKAFLDMLRADPNGAPLPLPPGHSALEDGPGVDLLEGIDEP